MYWFSKYAFSDAASREVLDPGTVLARLNRAEKEILNSLNFVPEMPLKDRKAKFSHKKLAKTGFVESNRPSYYREGTLQQQRGQTLLPQLHRRHGISCGPIQLRDGQLRRDHT